MSETQPVIPTSAEWPVLTLSQMTTLLRRGSAPVYVDDSAVRAIGQRCVTDADFDGSHARPHSERATKGVIVPAVGDVLINSTGTGTIGRSVIFREQNSNYIVDGHVTVARPRQSELNSRWLNDTLRSPEGQRYLETRCYAGSTNQIELSPAALAAMPLAAPEIAEQQRVAKILDAADDAIETSRLKIAKLRLLRLSTADDLLTRGIDDDGALRRIDRCGSEFRETAVGRRPTNWHVAPLGQFLARSDYGISSSLSDSGFIPILRMNNFARGEAKLDDLKYSDAHGAKRLLLKPGDVLFNRTNSLEHVGRTGIWRGQLDVASFASYLVRLVPSTALRSEYLNHVLNQRQVQIDLRRWATPGVHQVNVNPTNLRRVVVAVPDTLGEQDQICEALAALDAQIDQEVRVVTKLVAQKHGLAADLLCGRVRAPLEATA
jgi:type I restriction enzyme S subunit